MLILKMQGRQVNKLWGMWGIQKAAMLMDRKEVIDVIFLYFRSISYIWHSQKLMQTKLNYYKVGYDIGYYFFISLYLYITEAIEEEKDAGLCFASLNNVFSVYVKGSSCSNFLSMLFLKLLRCKSELYVNKPWQTSFIIVEKK